METKTSWTKPLIGLGLVVVVMGVVFALVFSAYRAEGENRSAWLSAGADEAATADRLDVSATVQAIDPVKGEMTVRLAFAPKGALASADGRSATKDLTIALNSSLKPEIKFKKGQPVVATDAVVDLFDGVYTDYPFDQHTGELEVYATASTPAATDGAKPAEEEVPVRVELFGFVHGFSLQAESTAESTPDYAAITLHVARATSTTVWAVFVMALLWFMTLAVAGVTFFVVITKRKLEFGSFAWMGAMLFAFVAFRNAAPGVPPLGSLIDFVAFFWAEFIVAICLVVMVIVYLVRQPK